MNQPIRDVNQQDFEQQVLARSHQVPVVVDFWAAWCQPCTFLAPVLEKEITALGGRVELVKIDVDANQALSTAFNIRGIPAVKAFRNGELVAEFEGARDAAFLHSWLAALAPSPGRQALELADQALGKGRLDEAEQTLRPLLDDPELASLAAFRLAGVLLDKGEIAEVPALLQRIDPRSRDADVIPALERRLGFIRTAEAFGGEAQANAVLAANPGDLEARYALGCALAARGETVGALEELLTVVTRSRKFRDDAARLDMLALFEQLGPASDRTREFRRRLQIVL